MFKAVRVLSIFYLKGGTSGSASRDIRTLLVIMAIDLWVSSSVGKRNAQEGTKTHGMQLHSCDIAVTRFGNWNVLVQYWHGTVAARDLAWYRLHWQVRRCRAELVLCQLVLSKWAGPARHGFEWQCKRSKRELSSGLASKHYSDILGGSAFTCPWARSMTTAFILQLTLQNMRCN